MGHRIGAPREKDPDIRLSRLAARQHGVVTRHQAMRAGFTRGMLDTRLRHRRLVRIHPGVYVIAGAPRTFEQRAFAATAWARDGFVSHHSAGYLWKVVLAAPAVVDVVSTRKVTRPPPGVCTRFTSALPARDCGTLNRIPITSLSRTLIDLAGVIPEREVEAALQRAISGGQVDARRVRRAASMAAGRGRRGPSAIARLLPNRNDRTNVPSPLERLAADVLTHPALPPFVREYPVYAAGRVYYVDFAFPSHLVGVEADGRRWHSGVEAFERDRVRQNALTAIGWQVLRVTYGQLTSDPDRIREQVRLLLDRARD